MSELEKILRNSIGKVVSVSYIIREEGGGSTITGTLKKVTDEVITISAIMTHHINRKITTLVLLEVKE